MYEMEDVPKEVWDEVYAKWDDALRNGWRHELWELCALCRWIIDKEGYIECSKCPLGKDKWCIGSHHGSRLNLGYDGDGYSGNEQKWKERVAEFLKFIKPYCSSEVGE